MTAQRVCSTLALAAVLSGAQAQAQESAQESAQIRLGNLKFAHYGAVSYIKEIAPQCGIKVDEKIFAKGLDVMQAIIAGELDVGAIASESAIAGRAGAAAIYIVAGFARGGARLVARPELNLKSVLDLKGKTVGVPRGSILEVLLMAELQMHGLSAGSAPGKDVHVIYQSYPELNHALLGKRIDAIMQSEPQSSQAINQGFGAELKKPYDTPIGEPVRTLIMTEKFYNEKRALAEKFMRCFVAATKTFIDDQAVAEKYVSEVVFNNQITSADFTDAIANSPYSYDITAQHIQITTDIMVKTGVGRWTSAPLATDWVRTDLLDAAKKSLGVK